MKIRSVRVHPVVVPRQYGTVIAKAGGSAKDTVERSYCYFVELTTDDGRTGWGEASDVDSKDLTKDPAEYAALLEAFLRGRNPYDLQRLHREYREHFDIENNSLAHYTESALDMACYDLQGQAAGQPIYDLLGGAVRPDVSISWVAYIRDDFELIREEVKEKIAQGFRAFKLKVGVDIDLDERRLALTREIAGKDVSIKVDANAGWSVDEAPKNIKRLNRYDLAGVETPVPRENPADIAAVRKQVDVPILEHVNTTDYALALLKAEAVDVFNISVPGCGGLWTARQVAVMSQSAGVGVLLGSTVEMGPGTLAQLHFAATVPNLTLPSDLIGPGMYKYDVLTEPLKYVGGKLKIPQGPGLGGQIDRSKLKELAV